MDYGYDVVYVLVVGLRRWMFYVIVYQEDIVEVVREDMEFLLSDVYGVAG